MAEILEFPPKRDTERSVALPAAARRRIALQQALEDFYEDDPEVAAAGVLALAAHLYEAVVGPSPISPQDLARLTRMRTAPRGPGAT